MSVQNKRVSVFAPATVANVASGFDILGFAVNGVGDTVTASYQTEPGVSIAPLSGIENANHISANPSQNTAGVPVLKLLEDHTISHGIRLEIKKGIPLGSGMGGSAASAVGAIVAVDHLLGTKLPLATLLHYALEGEAIASGSKHSDNIAPCLYGGFTLSNPGVNPQVLKLPFPATLYCVLVYPEMILNTKEARAVLKKEIPLNLHSEQSSRLAALIAGMCTSDFNFIRQGLEDLIVEPARAHLIPGFNEVKSAALHAGVLGCSISGAGPSVFALTPDLKIAETAKAKMIDAFLKYGNLNARAWVSPISTKGASIISEVLI